MVLAGRKADVANSGSGWPADVYSLVHSGNSKPDKSAEAQIASALKHQLPGGAWLVLIKLEMATTS